MVLVAGPRIDTASLSLPDEIEVRRYVPRLYELFAACDVAVVQGGATSAIELAALNKPFVFFPLEGHSEQANVARILRRRGVGVEMTLSRTTPASLGENISHMVAHKVTYTEIPVDGARNAALLISQLLDRQETPSVHA
jgi:UDP:flavonoid glycosyltransferase YjiC (YdhE family)